MDDQSGQPGKTEANNSANNINTDTKKINCILIIANNNKKELHKYSFFCVEIKHLKNELYKYFNYLYIK